MAQVHAGAPGRLTPLRESSRIRVMADTHDTTVPVAPEAVRLSDGVIPVSALSPDIQGGCRAFTHYNGPTDLLAGLCAGMATLEPGATPHLPHRHPEEELLIVAAGTGAIECGGRTTQVGPGDIMYCSGNVVHGITNTGRTPMTFYWSKWLASITSKT
jgi:mannose-6-phosphate isomerase-like protein (cupin superfamily)